MNDDRRKSRPRAGESLRMSVRRGSLARLHRRDPNGTLEEREPDELTNLESGDGDPDTDDFGQCFPGRA